MNKRKIIRTVVYGLYSLNLLYYGIFKQLDNKEFTRFRRSQTQALFEYTQLYNLEKCLNEEGLQLLKDKEVEWKSKFAEGLKRTDAHNESLKYNLKCAFFTKPLVDLVKGVKERKNSN